MQVRYDPEREIYRDCKWCHGKGCLSCKSEAEAAYKREFPNGPVPVATFDITTDEGIASARRAIGADAIKAAFSEGGVREVIENCKREQRADETRVEE